MVTSLRKVVAYGQYRLIWAVLVCWHGQCIIGQHESSNHNREWGYHVIPRTPCTIGIRGLGCKVCHSRVEKEEIMSSLDQMTEAISAKINCGSDSAKRIVEYYQREKILSFDKVNGGISLAHGAFMDKDILEAALEKVFRSLAI